MKNVAIPSEPDKEFDLYEVIDFQKDGSIFGHFDFDDFFQGGDNTLVIFLSDNGGCAEEPGGRSPEIIPGPKEFYASVGKD